MIEQVVFDSLQELQSAVRDLLVEAFAGHGSGPFAVMLSGGSTPLPVYEQLSTQDVRVSQHLHILFSDDRLVEPDSPESNAGNTRPMLDALRISGERILCVDGRMPPRVAAGRYDQAIKTFLDQGGALPLGILGLGADGHTASLFSLEDAGNTSAYAIPVHREDGPDRVSVTSKLLAQVERIIFMVAGSSKKEMVHALLTHPESVPSGVAVSRNPVVEIWMDREAKP